MSDEAYARLRDAIISGELPPGEPLRDFEIAETFGTSKTPIRHALDRLGEQGLVEIQRNRYSRVAAIDPHQVANALDVLGDTWGGAARRVGSTLEKADASALNRLVKGLSSAVSRHDLGAFATGLFSIASEYARIEGNPARQAAIEQLAAQVSRYWLASAHAFDWTAGKDLANGIAQALKTGDQSTGVNAIVTFIDTVRAEGAAA
ncbi:MULTISPECIES: GntR family transcriptional regulator [unclassified Microbacterium]|uniref:GntR family transcriptional regulator n=1 Tax=unclassified Microbacterium TaxID=2609290 RepID=UPI00160553F6|nr:MULTISPECIES: GntR family transcriptional regulator [unclassified Microbacterium]QNA92701.1 GntR family transcriptional regulator [Microbacterium sp. Se63.02b]QYM62835.1 GntR family transcriptional regulator [Microbacterium sp. Se5.02b]